MTIKSSLTTIEKFIIFVDRQICRVSNQSYMFESFWNDSSKVMTSSITFFIGAKSNEFICKKRKNWKNFLKRMMNIGLRISEFLFCKCFYQKQKTKNQKEKSNEFFISYLIVSLKDIQHNNKEKEGRLHPLASLHQISNEGFVVGSLLQNQGSSLKQALVFSWKHDDTKNQDVVNEQVIQLSSRWNS